MGKLTTRLFILCGKIAAGKTTLSHKLAKDQSAILISQDQWMSTLYPDEVQDLKDYVKYSNRLDAVIGPHVKSLLTQSISVVMDFPANTLEQRAWLKGLADEAGVVHQLYFLDVSDDVCKERLRERNASGEHPYDVSEAIFDQFNKYFVAPTADENLNVIVL
ncbi:AAA family ATPase [Curvivirga sp.]|uniref:AAA family ATPase n=1 Tax=Curvivirga sp. TaxID=2856848 RepID=UPI003B591A9A